MPRILDAHLHLYAPEVAADPVGWAATRGETWWSACVAPPGRRSLQGWATVDRLLRDMDRAGVELAVMLGWYWQHQSTCDEQNAWFADWCHRHPDRLRAFAAVQPAAGPAAVEATRRALDAGLCGIGELFAQAQGFGYRDETFAALVALAEERHVPFNLHVTDPVFAGAAGTPATPLAEFVELAAAHPGATFILAHWGGGLPLYELNHRVHTRLGNVFYDTSASALLYEPRIFRHMVDLIGAERIVFGTDYPLLTHPRETREPGLELSVRDALGAGVDPAALDAILGGNLRRLLRLP